MKKLTTFLVLIILSLPACGGSAQPVAEEPTALRPSSPARTPGALELLDVPWGDRAIFRQGLIEAERELLELLSGATVYHIDLEIPDDFLLLKGHQEVRYTNQETEPLSEIYFRLFPNGAGGRAGVSAVKVEGREVEPVYEYEDTAIRLPLATALEPGEQVVIEMGFEVRVPSEAAGNYGLLGYIDGALMLDEFYPVIPAYDDEGWNVETPSAWGDLTHFDASFYVVRVTAPAALKVVASGVEIGRQRGGDRQVLTFVAGPSRDFYLAASDQYTVVSEQVGETTVNSYSLGERGEGARLALEYAVAAIRSFNDRFGVYPYTEFDVVSTPIGSLGMEYPGLVAMGAALYDPDEQVLGLPSQVVLEFSVVHEVAHQWFYNVVGNDQVDEPWLDEAVVQYVVGLYLLDTDGARAQGEWSDYWHDRWFGVDGAEIPIGLPTGSYSDGQEYGAIVYGRGPLFIEALAERLGQEEFDQFMRDYYQSHRWGIGTGEAFRQLAEEHCSCDLSDLFEEWVY